MKEKIQALINEKKFSEIREEFRKLNNVEISDLLNQFDKSELIIIFRLLSKDQSADVFSYLEPEQQEIIINAVTDRETEVLFRNLYFDDMIDSIYFFISSDFFQEQNKADPDAIVPHNPSPDSQNNIFQ